MGKAINEDDRKHKNAGIGNEIDFRFRHNLCENMIFQKIEKLQ